MKNRDGWVAAIGGLAWLIILAVAVAATLWKSGGQITVSPKGFSFKTNRDPLSELIHSRDCDRYFGNATNGIKICDGSYIVGRATQVIDLSDSGSLTKHHLIHSGDWTEVSSCLKSRFCQQFHQILWIAKNCQNQFDIKHISLSYGAPLAAIVVQKNGNLEDELEHKCTITVREKQLSLTVKGIADLKAVRRIDGYPPVQISASDFKELVGSNRVGVVDAQLQCRPASNVLAAEEH
jgi:hypothetical protein